MRWWIMTTTSEILEAAQQRAKQMGLPYEGALLPKEAYELLQHLPSAKLVDVRTRAELEWVGQVRGAVAIEWKSYPSMQLNSQFADQLGKQVDPNAVVMFLCRSGGRSHEAAAVAEQAGYAAAYNVLEGVEGDPDLSGHRNSVGVWRAAGLPWVQG